MKIFQRAAAVIGAQFGDEGKGLLTDFLAGAGTGVLVVRANGGAQAGHTVVTPDGRRHVFGHLGSGSFRGAPTLLARSFVCNPLLLDREWTAVAGLEPRVLADPRGLVSTPWDMLVNQAVEAARGRARHGSCGVGFNETIERCLRPEFRTTVADLGDRTRLLRILAAIRDDYLPARMAALGLEPDPDLAGLMRSRPLLDGFLDACRRFLERVRPEEDARAVALAPQVLFEGAQGLLLDELHPWFPHVTRSRTGLANPAALCAEAGIERLRAVYVTRWYLTRHGAGPLPTEIPGRPSPLVEDRTNLPNPWQGSLRFGHLDLALLRQSIRADLAGAGRVDAVPALALTCLDQAGPEVTVVQDGRQLPVPRQRLPEILEAATGLAVRWQSHGPTRDDVLAGVGRSAPKGRPASVL